MPPGGRLLGSTEFLPSIAEIAGGSLRQDKVFDLRSFIPPLRGERGNPRDWIFIELAREWYVREAGWKLNQANELFDMSGSPFTELLLPAGKESADGLAVRQRVLEMLATLHPAGGILDDGDGTSRHANKPEKKTKKKSR